MPIFDAGAFYSIIEIRCYMDKLKEITDRLPGFPLVLHGASSVPQEFVDMCNKYGGNIPGAKGVPEELLREAAKYGVCKINIDSDIRLAMTANIREWRHFLKLRTAPAAHPQMREVANMLLDMCKANIPILFDDIEGY
jgi:fructose/tagatose bisphosphate aldolase